MLDISLTNEELELFKGKKEEAQQYLTRKAILDRAQEEFFTNEEKLELGYLYDTERVRLYVSKYVNSKINVDESEILSIYETNKQFFEEQKIEFAQARERIQADLVNQKAVQIENEYINEIVEKMESDVKFSKEDAKISQRNPEVMRTILMNRIISEDMSRGSFENDEKVLLNEIKENVLINYFIDKSIRDKVSVSQMEVEQVYNDNKENFANAPIEAAYNQIGNSLVMQKANQLRNELVEEISNKYKVEEVLNRYEL